MKVSTRSGARAFAFLWLCLVAALVLAACGQAAQPAPAPPEVVQRGARLYGAYCQSCHGDATGGVIQDYPPVHNANGHTWHHPDCVLVRITVEGVPPSPGAPADAPRMEGFKLATDDVKAILAYMKTWWTDKQRAFQADVTRQSC
ncbi:MAG: cytochrome c [Dehalococcoidia bacterium]|nr:cytochrome c [Dehalococcoidia bacterium]